jgi:hypothetical protein
VVPVIALRLRPAETAAAEQAAVTLSYKRGSKKITTRMPVIEVAAGEGDLFSMGTPIDVLIEAHDDAGRVVGEAKPGGRVNPATRVVSIPPGETLQITLKMDPEYEGKFTVKALDPVTQAARSKLNLQTDYMV